MHKALHNLPVLDRDALTAKAGEWKKALANAGPGGNRIVIEWSVGRGPNCFAYPAGKRGQGLHLVAADSHGQSDERWADYLEWEFVPEVVSRLKDAGVNPQVICVDLRPLQVQRERRRQLDAAARAKTGAAAH